MPHDRTFLLALLLVCQPCKCLGSKKLSSSATFFFLRNIFFLTSIKCAHYLHPTFLSAAVNASTLPSYLTFFISPLSTDRSMMKEELRIFFFLYLISFSAFISSIFREIFKFFFKFFSECQKISWYFQFLSSLERWIKLNVT